MLSDVLEIFAKITAVVSADIDAVEYESQQLYCQSTVHEYNLILVAM